MSTFTWKTIEVTYQEALMMQAGLSGLDGYTKIVKDGDKEKPVTLAFDFDFLFRRKIGKTKKALLEFCEEAEKVRNDIIRRHADGEDSVDPKNKVKMKAVSKETLAFDETKFPLDYVPLPIKDLQGKDGAENAIMPTVMGAIDRLIEQEDDKKPARKKIVWGAPAPEVKVVAAVKEAGEEPTNQPVPVLPTPKPTAPTVG